MAGQTIALAPKAVGAAPTIVDGEPAAGDSLEDGAPGETLALVVVPEEHASTRLAVDSRSARASIELIIRR